MMESQLLMTSNILNFQEKRQISHGVCRITVRIIKNIRYTKHINDHQHESLFNLNVMI